MKRFFLVFSIIMIVFLALIAGCLAAVQYGSIQTYKPDPVFINGVGITWIPYHGSKLVYPEGDLFVVRQASGQQIGAGKVVLVAVNDGHVSEIVSALVTGAQEDAFVVEAAGGDVLTVQPGDVLAVYETRVPNLAAALRSLGSPVSIAIYALVLAGSIALWRALPSKPDYAGLSRSDGEISSNLY